MSFEVKMGLAVALLCALVIGCIVVLAHAYNREQNEKQAACRAVGGVVVPGSWGWDCHMPAPAEKP